MIKFPSTSAGGTVPSASSFASTNPGVCGSRPGGVGRVLGFDGASAAITEMTPAIKPINKAARKYFVFMESYELVLSTEARTRTFSARGMYHPFRHQERPREMGKCDET